MFDFFKKKATPATEIATPLGPNATPEETAARFSDVDFDDDVRPFSISVHKSLLPEGFTFCRDQVKEIGRNLRFNDQERGVRATAAVDAAMTSSEFYSAAAARRIHVVEVLLSMTTEGGKVPAGSLRGYIFAPAGNRRHALAQLEEVARAYADAGDLSSEERARKINEALDYERMVDETMLEDSKMMAGLLATIDLMLLAREREEAAAH